MCDIFAADESGRPESAGQEAARRDAASERDSGLGGVFLKRTEIESRSEFFSGCIWGKLGTLKTCSI